MKKEQRLPVYTPEILREKLIDYIDFLLPKKHILSIESFRYYRMKLRLDECLSPHEMEHIFKFLVRDSDRSIRDLRTIFSPITLSNETKKTPHSLEEFFI